MGVLEDIVKNISFCHQIEKDSYRLLEYHGCKEVAEHCIRVAAEAEKLANRFNADRTFARIAGYLHDAGRVFPDKQSINIACELGIQVLDEKHACAGLLHQKISRVIASELFGIKNNVILNVIECHTTLKSRGIRY